MPILEQDQNPDYAGRCQEKVPTVFGVQSAEVGHHSHSMGTLCPQHSKVNHMILIRSDPLGAIADWLAWLESSCRRRGILHLFDNNVVMHHFLCRLLSKVYGHKH